MKPNLPDDFSDEPRKIARNTALSVVEMQRQGFSDDDILLFFGAEGGAGQGAAGMATPATAGSEGVMFPDGGEGDMGGTQAVVPTLGVPGMGGVTMAEGEGLEVVGVGALGTHTAPAGEAEPSGGDQVGGVLRWEEFVPPGGRLHGGAEDDGERGRKRQRGESFPVCGLA